LFREFSVTATSAYQIPLIQIPIFKLTTKLDLKHTSGICLGHNVAYKLFTTKAIRFGSPALTINSDGRVVLNADAGDLLAPGVKFVQILWDATEYKVALRPLVRSGESSYKLYIKGGKRGTHFSARTFLRYIGWDLSRSATVPIAWNQREKVLEASLPREHFAVNADSQGQGQA
jgi:hypothetical protein